MPVCHIPVPGVAFAEDSAYSGPWRLLVGTRAQVTAVPRIEKAGLTQTTGCASLLVTVVVLPGKIRKRLIDFR